MLSWFLLVGGLVMVFVGLVVGVISYEVTLALIVAGAIAAVAGAYMLLRGRRTTG
jgi:hypothetical protein